jgi:hypothetical protein
MFKSREIDPETNAVLVPAPMDHLDPLREHRFFCPWKDAAAQRNPGAKRLSKVDQDKAGWEMLVQVLKNDAYLRSRAAGTHAKSSVNTPATTPVRPSTAVSGKSLIEFGPDGEPLEEDEATRSAKDKERWARLRRVKSLFNTKAGNKLKRATSSRPGTGHSSKSRPATGHSTKEDIEQRPQTGEAV